MRQRRTWGERLLQSDDKRFERPTFGYLPGQRLRLYFTVALCTYLGTLVSLPLGGSAAGAPTRANTRNSFHLDNLVMVLGWQSPAGRQPRCLDMLINAPADIRHLEALQLLW